MVNVEIPIAVQERVPPQSLEAEQSVLGALLANPDILSDVISILNSECFYKQPHKLIYETILELFNKSEPIDIITVSEALQNKGLLDDAGGRSYINDLALSVVTTANVEYHAKYVAEKAVLRNLIKAGTEIVTVSYEEPDADAAIDKAESLIFSIAQKRQVKDLVPIEGIIQKSFEMLEERYSNRDELLGVPSGFYDLDNLTAGFQQADLAIVAARPSMGKTSFALNIALNVALKCNKPVAIFSLEMTKEQLVQRLLCSEAEIDSNRIRTGYMQIEDWDRISTAMGKLAYAPIYIDDSPAATVMEIRTKTRKLKMERGDLSLIVIDYLQLMEGKMTGRVDRVQEISTISRGLKSLAREVEAPVIALSQLSRAVEQRQIKKPMLSDLRESGSIEQDADLVMFIYREEYYNPDAVEKRGMAELIVAKQRNGPIGTVNLIFQPNITKFKNPQQKDRGNIY